MLIFCYKFFVICYKFLYPNVKIAYLYILRSKKKWSSIQHRHHFSIHFTLHLKEQCLDLISIKKHLLLLICRKIRNFLIICNNVIMKCATLKTGFWLPVRINPRRFFVTSFDIFSFSFPLLSGRKAEREEMLNFVSL